MIPKINVLTLPKIIDAVQNFPSKGETQITENNLFHLKINDAYVHKLFPLLGDKRIQKPEYFGEKSAGAHISIIYPEENRNINQNDLQQEHHFFIKNIANVEIGKKIYYVLLAQSPALVELRKKYNLPRLLCFKGYSIEFHITIGVINLG